jgi:hypothetical protein
MFGVIIRGVDKNECNMFCYQIELITTIVPASGQTGEIINGTIFSNLQAREENFLLITKI